MTIRVSILIKRKEGMSVEDFNEYWSTNHGRLFSSMSSVKEHLVRYSQFHVLPAPSAALAAGGMPISQFDGAAEFWVEKIEDLLAVFSSEEYKTLVIPDEQKFFQREQVQVLIGEEQVKWEKP